MKAGRANSPSVMTSRPRSTWRATAARTSASTISSRALVAGGARLEQARRAQQAPHDLGASGLARRVHPPIFSGSLIVRQRGRAPTTATVPCVLVDAWLPRAAERHPDRPAVNAMTYAELLGEVDATARRLAGRGVRAGDRVGIALAPGEGFCIALHAVLRLGAVAVPVDLRLERARARARARRARWRSSTAPSSRRRPPRRACATATTSTRRRSWCTPRARAGRPRRLS